ncbi:MAG: methyltransferase domain-containing protein [Patescibacteria group bacterium]
MIELQQKLLGDHLRNQAFYDALKKVIKKGKTTLADIGSGTGFLSFLAARLGAKACYLYEYSELLPLSRKLAAANKIPNCHFIHGHSAEVARPVPVDVIVSETLGNFALEENIIENLEDAKRFLKPGGVIIPGKLEQFIAPVISPRITSDLNVWDHIDFDFNFSLMKVHAFNNMFVYRITPQDLLDDAGAVQVFDRMDFEKPCKSLRRGDAQWEFKTDQTIYGFAVWWRSELVPGISLSTSPFEEPTHWDQVFLPLLKPMQIKKSDELICSIETDSRYTVGIRMKWEAIISGHGKKQKSGLMDTQKGLN